jgi:hypothetical protein
MNEIAEMLRKLAGQIRLAGKDRQKNKTAKRVKCAQAATALGLLARKLGA